MYRDYDTVDLFSAEPTHSQYVYTLTSTDPLEFDLVIDAGNDEETTALNFFGEVDLPRTMIL